MTDSPVCPRCPHCAEPLRPARSAAATSDSDVAAPFPMPVPLLMQLTRPLATLEDIDSLAAQLSSAQARGCF